MNNMQKTADALSDMLAPLLQSGATVNSLGEFLPKGIQNFLAGLTSQYITDEQGNKIPIELSSIMSDADPYSVFRNAKKKQITQELYSGIISPVTNKVLENTVKKTRADPYVQQLAKLSGTSPERLLFSFQKTFVFPSIVGPVVSALGKTVDASEDPKAKVLNARRAYVAKAIINSAMFGKVNTNPTHLMNVMSDMMASGKFEKAVKNSSYFNSDNSLSKKGMKSFSENFLIADKTMGKLSRALGTTAEHIYDTFGQDIFNPNTVEAVNKVSALAEAKHLNPQQARKFLVGAYKTVKKQGGSGNEGFNVAVGALKRYNPKVDDDPMKALAASTQEYFKQKKLREKPEKPEKQSQRTSFNKLFRGGTSKAPQAPNFRKVTPRQAFLNKMQQKGVYVPRTGSSSNAMNFVFRQSPDLARKVMKDIKKDYSAFTKANPGANRRVYMPYDVKKKYEQTYNTMKNTNVPYKPHGAIGLLNYLADDKNDQQGILKNILGAYRATAGVGEMESTDALQNRFDVRPARKTSAPKLRKEYQSPYAHRF